MNIIQYGIICGSRQNSGADTLFGSKLKMPRIGYVTKYDMLDIILCVFVHFFSFWESTLSRFVELRITMYKISVFTETG
jgi:hypothetical protein